MYSWSRCWTALAAAPPNQCIKIAWPCSVLHVTTASYLTVQRNAHWPASHRTAQRLFAFDRFAFIENVKATGARVCTLFYTITMAHMYILTKPNECLPNAEWRPITIALMPHHSPSSPAQETENILRGFGQFAKPSSPAFNLRARWCKML